MNKLSENLTKLDEAKRVIEKGGIQFGKITIEEDVFIVQHGKLFEWRKNTNKTVDGMTIKIEETIRIKQ